VANHFSQELPRLGLSEESAAGRDRFFFHLPAGLSGQHEPNGRRNTLIGKGQPIVLNATSKA
jgi:hypothetical protein